MFCLLLRKDETGFADILVVRFSPGYLCVPGFFPVAATNTKRQWPPVLSATCTEACTAVLNENQQAFPRYCSQVVFR